MFATALGGEVLPVPARKLAIARSLPYRPDTRSRRLGCMRNTADVTQRQDEHLDSYEQWARDRLEPVLLHQLALPALVTEDRQNLMPWSPTATVWSEPRPR